MNKVIFLSFMIVACSGHQERGSQTKSDGDGVLGTTCYAQPSLKSLETDREVCRWPQSPAPGTPPGEFFYPGITGVGGKAATVQACHDANALDHGAEAGPGKSCYDLCDAVTYCIAGTSGI